MFNFETRSESGVLLVYKFLFRCFALFEFPFAFFGKLAVLFEFKTNIIIELFLRFNIPITLGKFCIFRFVIFNCSSHS